MKKNNQLDLREITLCAADCLNPHLAARALTKSADLCRFGDSILFTHDAKVRSKGVRIKKIPPLTSKDDYSVFILKKLAEYIKTDWVMIVQWDGFVVDPSAWMPEFLHYDYIGAEWLWHEDGMTVGNGGFSLRSKKLLRLCADRLDWEVGYNEDELICKKYRSVLESDHGIRFAPVEIARRFSYEEIRPEYPTFGFHGAFNMWRHLSDEEIGVVIQNINHRNLVSSEMIKLFMTYFNQRRFFPVRLLYKKLRAVCLPKQIEDLMVSSGSPAERVAECVAVCEEIYK
jgi:hypothetical protein